MAKLRTPSLEGTMITAALLGMAGAAVSAAASTSALSEHSTAKRVTGGALLGIVGGAALATGTLVASMVLNSRG